MILGTLVEVWSVYNSNWERDIIGVTEFESNEHCRWLQEHCVIKESVLLSNEDLKKLRVERFIYED
tara:strand:- start:6159 stop:6356 length:198 start_codon:yes stop_codon:yes gene_type:complete